MPTDAARLVTDLHGEWSSSWAWSLPLILLTVLGHSFGLVALTQQVAAIFGREVRRFQAAAGLAMTVTVLVVILLHAVEAGLWGAAYLWLGALREAKSSMLYSLEAMTTYGHSNVDLAAHWRLMGALEALNGMILFGLTTAFLFRIIQTISVSKRAHRPRSLRSAASSAPDVAERLHSGW